MPISVITENTTVQNATADNQYTGFSTTAPQEDSPTDQFSLAGFIGVVNSATPGSDVISLLRADGLSNIPSNAVVTSATLYIRSVYTDAGTINVDLRRVLSSWVLGTATWNTRDGTTAWNTAGAQGDGTDRVATPESTTSIGSAGSTWFGLDCTSLVQDIIDGTIASDEGFHLSTADAAGTIRTYTSSVGTDNQRPELVVDYTVGAAASVDDINTTEIVTDAEQNCTYEVTGFIGSITTIKIKSGTAETSATGITVD